ncbi:TIGR02530 family flagellar biosynthesis protein [Paenibacillus sp. M1]|uniref:TIGR02530 family flagellar biosynthesis protein n=1 Tax=Paenibacillus haidiansis TaxID=1574488 RepID=A0ABU7VPG4_9BACL
MNEPISVGQLFPGRVGPGALLQPKKQTAADSAGSRTSFSELLNDRLLSFSNHAVKRLEQRGIQLKPEQITQIESAIDSAAAKGAKDSLILMKDLAFIVNVHNRTVVTAMDSKSMQSNVFTNIDSAVVIS